VQATGDACHLGDARQVRYFEPDPPLMNGHERVLTQTRSRALCSPCGEPAPVLSFTLDLGRHLILRSSGLIRPDSRTSCCSTRATLWTLDGGLVQQLACLK
jgi:hypothetical protein